MCRIRILLVLVVCALALNRVGATNGGEPHRDEDGPRKILFDTDPGGDDTFALLWLMSLARQGHAEIVAVTTVRGNVDGRHTFENACRILALGGFGSVEVGRCSTGTVSGSDAAYIHGADGMGNLSHTLPPGTRRWDEARTSADIIIEKLRARPYQVTVVAVGPLTNLAAAEEKSPGILAKAKELVVMGGAFGHRGNITSQAEFNIHSDPGAAAKVFASRSDIVMLPLDVTTRITFTAHHATAAVQPAPNTRIAILLTSLARFLTKTNMGYRDTDGVAGFLVHDAATLAYLFYPETLLMRRARVRVETEGRWTRGQTVFDQRHGAKSASNAWVAMQVDATNLLAILVEDLKLISAVK